MAQNQLYNFYSKTLGDGLQLFKNGVEFENAGEIYGQLNSYSLAAATFNNGLASLAIIRSFTSTSGGGTDANTKNKLDGIEKSLRQALNLVLVKVVESQKLYKNSGPGRISGGGGGGFDNNEDEDKLVCKVEPLSFKEGSAACNIWFSTIIGATEAKKDIENSIVNPTLWPTLFPIRGKGILFYGPPGTGKTLLAKACVNQLKQVSDSLDVLFYAPTGADLKGKYVGDTEKNIRAVFKCASGAATQKSTKDKEVIAIIFLDEVESLAPDRSNGNTSGSEATTVNALLQAMDGINSAANITLIAATNYPWQLDGAFLRRFDKTIHVGLPTAKEAAEIIKLQITNFLIKVCGSVEQKTYKNDSIIKNKNTEWFKSKNNDLEKLLIVKNKSQKQIQEGAEDSDNASSVLDCSKPPEIMDFSAVKKDYGQLLTIEEDEIIALGTQLNVKGYSNSDIINVWKNVLNRSGEEAYKIGIFEPNFDFANPLLVLSTNVSKEKNFAWLRDPDVFSVEIGDIKFNNRITQGIPINDEDNWFENIFISEKDNGEYLLLECRITIEQDDGTAQIGKGLSLEGLSIQTRANLTASNDLIKDAYRQEIIYFRVKKQITSGISFFSTTSTVNLSSSQDELMKNVDAIYCKWDSTGTEKITEYNVNNAKKVWDIIREKGFILTKKNIFDEKNTTASILNFNSQKGIEITFKENKTIIDHLKKDLRYTFNGVENDWPSVTYENLMDYLLNDKFENTKVIYGDNNKPEKLKNNNPQPDIFPSEIELNETTVKEIQELRVATIKYSKSFKVALAKKAASFAFSYKHFIDAIEVIKPTAKRTDVDNLIEYQKDPTGFKLKTTLN